MAFRPDQPYIRTAVVAAFAIACTYFYFLLFSEFALLALAGGTTLAAQRTMTGLVFGGIVGSFGGARYFRVLTPSRTLAWCLLAGSVLAASAPRWAGLPAAWVGAAASGLALGCATVTLASSLRHWVPCSLLGRVVGVGTGAAYALANVPPLFSSSATAQSLAAGAVAAAGGLACLVAGMPRPSDEEAKSGTPGGTTGIVAALIVFSALVWMDSAAFFVIQHSDALRTSTWAGERILWGNALMHFFAACLAGVFLDRNWPRFVLGGAWVLLALACEALIQGTSFKGDARWAYTAGVSLYSTALVWWAARGGRPWIAALLFCVAGWIASALGIGMVQHLATIPSSFLIASGTLTALGLGRLRRLPAVLVLALMLGVTPSLRAGSAAALGRRVYVAEGCISCHSQYLRADVPADVLDWGPIGPAGGQPAGRPPLIGNRRLGPDLSRVGLRRTPEWNRIHLMDPQAIDRASTMPSYAPLFARGDPRGPALVAYLATLGRGLEAARAAQIASWRPPLPQAVAPRRGLRLWTTLCAGCHGEQGRGNGPVAHLLSQRPPDFSSGHWSVLASTANHQVSIPDLMRLIKFGIAGTPMAGHEYLTDGDLRALAARVVVLHGLAQHENSDRRG